jgi:hypothetical protein
MRRCAEVLQVLDAERSYQQARLGYVRSVVQRYFEAVQLFLALGGMNPSGSPEVTSLQPAPLSRDITQLRSELPNVL